MLPIGEKPAAGNNPRPVHEMARVSIPLPPDN